MNFKEFYSGAERGSLPGLAAVLLVIVVVSIGVTSSAQLPDPAQATVKVQGLINAVGGVVVIGARLGSDGLRTTIGANDPDYVQSVANLRAVIGGPGAGAETACVAVVRTRPNATCTTFTSVITTEDPTFPVQCDAAPDTCRWLALAQHLPNVCEVKYHVCVRTFGSSPQMVTLPAGASSLSFSGIL